MANENSEQQSDASAKASSEEDFHGLERLGQPWRSDDLIPDATATQLCWRQKIAARQQSCNRA